MNSIPQDRLLVLKIVSLVFGCVAKFITGSLFTFNVYQNDIKSTFNYSQTEVEVMSSMLNIGLGVGFLPGMFYDRFGPQWTSAVGLLVSVGAYMLLWSTTRSNLVLFYSKNSWLMAIFFFIAGFGSIFTYMVVLNTNIINFDQKHTGKVVGLLNAFFAGSPSIFAVLYYHVFQHGDSHDYPGFLLLFAVSFGITDLLCIVFVRAYRETDTKPIKGNEEDKTEEEKLSFEYKRLENRGTGIQESSADYVAFPRVQQLDQQATTHMPLAKLLINIDYHLLVWLLAFSTSVGLVYVNNITTASKSLCTTEFEPVLNVSTASDNVTQNSTTTCLSSYDDRLTIIIPITTALISIFVGVFSDFMKEKLPRLWIIIFGCVCFVISQVIVLSLANKIFFLMLATVFAGIASGIIWSLAPTVMQELFFVGNLGRNWGIAILVAELLGFGMQEIYGALYDAKTIRGSNDCIGMDCIRGGVIVCLVSACISVAFGILMQFRKACQRTCNKPL